MPRRGRANPRRGISVSSRWGWGPSASGKMSLIALSELLGAAVRDPSGAVKGRVREVAVAPQDHATRIAYLIVRTAEGDRTLPAESLKACGGATVRAIDDASTWDRYTPSDGVLLLKRDLLDQQIIDVYGRKVVR